MRARLSIPLLASLLLAAPFSHAAEQKKPQPVPSCIGAEVNGYRSMSYDCLGQQMSPDTPPNRPNPALSSQDVTRRPPNQAGLVTPATTANRMGGNFGNSAFPQRPPAMQGGMPAGVRTPPPVPTAPAR
ncbi:hypothetical protein ANDO1_3146 [plant metagenome]|uniref:Uncharacterized protein n=1 Tax=plant metagenome TaxID=1297885 RepID=A0A484PMA3_9ZZZZ